MSLKRLVAGFAAACSLAGGASAATVAFTFEGRISSVEGFDLAAGAADNRFSISVFFDPDAPGTLLATDPSGGELRGYESSGVAFSFGGQTFSSQTRGSLFIGDGTTDTFGYQSDLISDLNANVVISFTDFSGSIFDSAALSEPVAFAQSGDVSALDIADIFFTTFAGPGQAVATIFGACSPGTSCGVTVSADAVALANPVPLPAALPLMGAGLAGLGWAAGRRRRSAPGAA